MEHFDVVTGPVAALDRNNVDTDQIIPKQFLKRIERTGYGQFLFWDWAKDDDFPLNRPEYARAPILVAGANFGCGSSREHAAWALADYGFRAVIAPSFADIFRGNALKNGLLPVALGGIDTSGELVVDLDCQTVTAGAVVHPFEVEPFARKLLLSGQDELGYLLSFMPQIEAFECRPRPRAEARDHATLERVQRANWSAEPKRAGES